MIFRQKTYISNYLRCISHKGYLQNTHHSEKHNLDKFRNLVNLCHILPKFLTFDVIFVTSYYDVITCKWLLVCFVIKFRLCLVSTNNICYHSMLALLFYKAPKLRLFTPPIDAYPSVKSWMHPPLKEEIFAGTNSRGNLISRDLIFAVLQKIREIRKI